MLSKDQICQDALLKLRAQGARVRKVHNVSAYKKRRGQVEPGVSDIGGYTCKGVYIEIEVKTVNDRLSEAQRERLLDIDKCGGIACIATEQNGQTIIVTIADYLFDN